MEEEKIPKKFQRKRSSRELNEKEEKPLVLLSVKIPRGVRINNNSSNNNLKRGFFGSSTNENSPDL